MKRECTLTEHDAPSKISSPVPTFTSSIFKVSAAEAPNATAASAPPALRRKTRRDREDEAGPGGEDGVPESMVGRAQGEGAHARLADGRIVGETKAMA